MKETLYRIHSQLGDIIDDIPYDEYSSLPLVSYVNDSLVLLSEFLEYFISLPKK